MRAPRKAKAPVSADTSAAEKAPSADEAGMSHEVLELVTAIDDYKRANQRPFPTWSEVLGVLKKLGYRKSA